MRILDFMDYSCEKTPIVFQPTWMLTEKHPKGLSFNVSKMTKIIKNIS